MADKEQLQPVPENETPVETAQPVPENETPVETAQPVPENETPVETAQPEKKKAKNETPVETAQPEKKKAKNETPVETAMKKRKLETAEDVMSFFGLRLDQCVESNIEELEEMGLTDNEMVLVMKKSLKEIKAKFDFIPSVEISTEIRDIMLKYGVVVPDFKDLEALKGKVGMFDDHKKFVTNKKDYEVLRKFVEEYVAK